MSKQQPTTAVALRSLRDMTRLTLRNAAQVSGASAAYICRVEKGEHIPSPSWSRHYAASLLDFIGLDAASTKTLLGATVQEAVAA